MGDANLLRSDEHHRAGGEHPRRTSRSSHLWPEDSARRAGFHALEDLAPVAVATPEGVEPERVPVVVKAGGAAFHHGWTFHGSGPNEATVERRALSRYRRRGDLSLDESFFPVLWDDTGARSAWLAGLPQLP